MSSKANLNFATVKSTSVLPFEWKTKKKFPCKYYQARQRILLTNSRKFAILAHLTIWHTENGCFGPGNSRSKNSESTQQGCCLQVCPHAGRRAEKFWQHYYNMGHQEGWICRGDPNGWIYAPDTKNVSSQERLESVMRARSKKSEQSQGNTHTGSEREKGKSRHFLLKSSCWLLTHKWAREWVSD